MKYQCLECKETFVHSATITNHFPNKVEAIDGTHDGILETSDIMTINVCPYCRSRHFDELKLEEARITSVKSVPIEEVDDWIAKGYEVEALYQKSANLIKREQKKTITVAYLEEVKKEES